MSEAMNSSLVYLQGLVQKETPVDTGMLRGSIFTEIRGRETDNINGIVGTPLMYGVVVEFGRRPGQTPPPVAVIKRWAVLHGLSEGLAYPIARAIGRRGIPGRFMFRYAAQRGLGTVTGILRRALSRGV